MRPTMRRRIVVYAAVGTALEAHEPVTGAFLGCLSATPAVPDADPATPGLQAVAGAGVPVRLLRGRGRIRTGE